MWLTPAKQQVTPLNSHFRVVGRPRSGHRSCHGGIAIPARTPRTHVPSMAEAAAWAEVLVSHQLLHAAVLAPTGQWLVQHHAHSAVEVLANPSAMVDLAAEIQHRIRSTRNHTR